MDLGDFVFIARSPTLSSSHHFVLLQNVKCCGQPIFLLLLHAGPVGSVPVMRSISTFQSFVLSTGQRALLGDCGNAGKAIHRGSNQSKVCPSVAIVRPTLQSTVCALFVGVDDTRQPTWSPIPALTLDNTVIKSLIKSPYLNLFPLVSSIRINCQESAR